MKLADIDGRYTIPLTNEEVELMARFSVGSTVPKKELNEREREIANKLVVKEVLIRKDIDGKIIYKQNERSSLI